MQSLCLLSLSLTDPTFDVKRIVFLVCLFQIYTQIFVFIAAPEFQLFSHLSFDKNDPSISWCYEKHIYEILFENTTLTFTNHNFWNKLMIFSHKNHFIRSLKSIWWSWALFLPKFTATIKELITKLVHQQLNVSSVKTRKCFQHIANSSTSAWIAMETTQSDVASCKIAIYPT